MKSVYELKPFENELPSMFADRLGLHYTKTVTSEHKKITGNFYSYRNCLLNEFHV